MRLIRTKNVNDALPKGINLLQKHGTLVDGCHIMREPVTVIHSNPLQRVLFDHVSPFFQLRDALQIIGGFDPAHIDRVLDKFHKVPAGRRVSTSIVNDSEKEEASLLVHMWIHWGRLNMLSFSSSFCIPGHSMPVLFFQEYIASILGIKVGKHWQVINNYHVYKDFLLKYTSHNVDWYTELEPFPLLHAARHTWDQDLLMFLEHPQALGFRHSFFRKIAKPMWDAFQMYKAKDFEAAFDILAQMPANNDWRWAAELWIQRKAQQKAGEQIDERQE